jgi:hypothetical protein
MAKQGFVHVRIGVQVRIILLPGVQFLIPDSPYGNQLRLRFGFVDQDVGCESETQLIRC